MNDSLIYIGSSPDRAMCMFKRPLISEDLLTRAQGNQIGAAFWYVYLDKWR